MLIISVFFKDALLGVTKIDKIRNEHIGKTAQVEYFGDKVREVRLRWFWECAEEAFLMY